MHLQYVFCARPDLGELPFAMARSHFVAQNLEYVDVDEERILEALHSCPKLCSHLGLQGLACLAACSNRLLKGCLSCCRSEAVALTAGAIEAAATAKGRQQEQQLAAVVW
jgi:hypothetical protein